MRTQQINVDKRVAICMDLFQGSVVQKQKQKQKGWKPLD